MDEGCTLKMKGLPEVLGVRDQEKREYEDTWKVQRLFLFVCFPNLWTCLFLGHAIYEDQNDWKTGRSVDGQS